MNRRKADTPAQQSPAAETLNDRWDNSGVRMGLVAGKKHIVGQSHARNARRDEKIAVR